MVTDAIHILCVMCAQIANYKSMYTSDYIITYNHIIIYILRNYVY